MDKVTIFLDKFNVQLKDEILDSFSKETLNQMKINFANQHELEIEFPDRDQKYIELISYKIASYIIETIEEKTISNIVTEECDGLLTNEDLDEIITKVKWELIYSDDKILGLRIRELHDEIKNFLQNTNQFDLKGYLKFRFKVRILEMREKINEVIDNFFEEQEIDDFTAMVNHFVSIQVPKLDYVHIVVTDNEKYEIFTSNKEKVDLGELEELLNEVNASNMQRAITMEDLVISTLMSLLPKEVYIHYNSKHNPKFPSILQKIYAGRSIKCENCELCHSVRNKGKKKIRKKKKEDKHEDFE